MWIDRDLDWFSLFTNSTGAQCPLVMSSNLSIGEIQNDTATLGDNLLHAHFH